MTEHQSPSRQADSESTAADAVKRVEAFLRAPVSPDPGTLMNDRLEFIALARRAGNPRLLIDALLWGHRMLLDRGFESAASEARDESRSIAVAISDEAQLAYCDVCEALALAHGGLYAQAIVKVKLARPRLGGCRDPLRARATAAACLTTLFIALTLFDEAVDTADEAAALRAEADDEQGVAYYRYLGLISRLCRADARYAAPPISPDDPDLMVVIAGARTAIALTEKWPTIAFANRFLLFDALRLSGREAEAVAAWRETAHIPDLWGQLSFRARVALHCEGPDRALEVLRPVVTEGASSPEMSHQMGRMAWEIMSEAHERKGDYRAAYEAHKMLFHLSSGEARRTAQMRATLLTLELEDEREKALVQRALTHAGKLAAVGQLASTLAHEISQPSAALVLLSGQAFEALAERRFELLAEVLGDVDAQAQRLNSLVNRMREFSRDDPLQIEDLNLHDVVNEGLLLCRPMISAARVAHSIDVPDLLVRADKSRLILMLVNLVNNAVDAMRGQEHTEPMLRIEAARHEGLPPQVCLSVIDNGSGLSLEAQEQLFQPFFTTKSTGLGLGLTITREALAGMTAKLEGRNEPGGGARFSVLLPAVNPA
jgi:signal transduction histidine kinase